MSLEQELAQAKAKIAELELDVKLTVAGSAGRGVAAAVAAATAAGKKPLMQTEFDKMSPLKKMQLMKLIASGDSDRELIDDRDV